MTAIRHALFALIITLVPIGHPPTFAAGYHPSGRSHQAPAHPVTLHPGGHVRLHPWNLP
jgi:hypothetical protein